MVCSCTVMTDPMISGVTGTFTVLMCPAFASVFFATPCWMNMLMFFSAFISLVKEQNLDGLTLAIIIIMEITYLYGVDYTQRKSFVQSLETMHLRSLGIPKSQWHAIAVQ